MPDTKKIVINTGPIIALTAAWGDLTFLSSIYKQILVPFEVSEEIGIGGKKGFAVNEFNSATFLHKEKAPLRISPFLANTLDRGEASVIQLALNEKIQTVCIDETVGRRIARLNGLDVTGSVGVLIRAKKEGLPFSMKYAVEQMQRKGIWLSERVIKIALTQTND
ncbi:DUF3368 domain-containing protein [Desulfonema magnum]|uniref:DUF3368 n=1 Tax=Desulfonema magnum TaxID=45655 RepID=A0A975BGG0_9BACT|nr:DUF3368 domain-containing protein [Desulfonema magnum]QTA84848.1 DUF3368 [Desulfonema magnum]